MANLLTPIFMSLSLLLPHARTLSLSLFLSFPLICNRFQINFVSLISDALYSDYPPVLDALAELMEVTLRVNTEKRVSIDRMAQARYIVEVDEDSFRAVSREDLFRIESTEMDEIAGELFAAIGLQRFRYGERQDSGKYENLSPSAFCFNATTALLGQLSYVTRTPPTTTKTTSVSHFYPGFPFID